MRLLLPLVGLFFVGAGCNGDDSPPTETGTTPTADTGAPVTSDVQIAVEVTGLLGDGLVLQNNGADDLAVAADGTSTFTVPIAIGDPYAVTVLTQPLRPPQRCTVASATGTATANTAALAVTCETYHVAFVTSSQGQGNLGAWPDAGGQTGLAAGDAICQAHAARGNLPGTFVAWASDDTDDAYCRVAGFSGKADANCGQATLPEAAGPWVRTDGRPFASPLASLVSPAREVLLPPTYDESGNELDEIYFVTATTDNGRASRTSPCDNWTSTNPDSPMSGGITTSANLASWGGNWCPIDAPLLCLQSGPGIELPPPPAAPADAHLMFVSSTQVTGSAGGIAGADALCTSLANAAGYPGTFESFLSDSTTDGRTRIDHEGAWVRPDGQIIANRTEDLLAGDLLSPMHQTETGDYSYEYAWTGLAFDGQVSTDTCLDWTSEAPMGTRALPFAATTEWWHFADWPCDRTLHVYCYED